MTVQVQASDFTAAFPEFSNATTYPVAQIAFWIGEAYTQLPCRIQPNNLAVFLYVAHNVTLSARDAAVASAGGIVGQATGPMSSKSVGGVSASYDTHATVLDGAGYYNATSYGQRLWAMLKGLAAGPVYRPSRMRSLPYPGQPF